MKRREFVKLTTLTAAGLAAGVQDLFAGDSYVTKAEADAYAAGRLAAFPHPINEGPGPLWEDFQYITHGPDWYWLDPLTDEKPIPGEKYPAPGSWTVGWKGYLALPGEERKQYGDYVIITDVYDEAIAATCKLLLKEQADLTRHQLIKDAAIQCYCTECKAMAIFNAVEERRGTRIFVTAMNPCNSTRPAAAIAIASTIKGKGKGWVRAASCDAHRRVREAVMALEGPTHGY